MINLELKFLDLQYFFLHNTTITHTNKIWCHLTSMKLGGSGGGGPGTGWMGPSGGWVCMILTVAVPSPFALKAYNLSSYHVAGSVIRAGKCHEELLIL